uniref:PGG domain-containing protein n=1 Tax=Fagus sylvatica TaxID=28930 RepID=A0A2N9FUC7_FAGSY
MQAVSHLLAWAPQVFCVNIKNLEGKTALDILQEQTQVNREMKVKLCRAKALMASSLPTVTSYADYLMQPKVKFGRFLTIYACDVIRIFDEKCNALLVVSVLLITVTYQAVLNPPRGLWQDDYKPETNQTQWNTTAAYEAGEHPLV